MGGVGDLSERCSPSPAAHFNILSRPYPLCKKKAIKKDSFFFAPGAPLGVLRP